jgi:hypothetical protein
MMRGGAGEDRAGLIDAEAEGDGDQAGDDGGESEDEVSLGGRHSYCLLRDHAGALGMPLRDWGGKGREGFGSAKNPDIVA